VIGIPVENYRFQIASGVSASDRFAVEVVDAAGERLLEVFRDGERSGELRFNSFGTASVPFSVAVSLVQRP